MADPVRQDLDGMRRIRGGRASEGARRLTDPVPEWEAKYVDQKVRSRRPALLRSFLTAVENLLDERTHPRPPRSVPEILACVDLLLDAGRLGGRAVVIGCGPRPETMTELAASGYEVVGVEPVDEGRRQAEAYLAGRAAVVQGTAERLPLADGSQALVLMENVLEHVDSVTASLAESYRVLKPGGVLFVRTTNRKRFSATGINWEYSTRFFNWFPRGVQESYVFAQLHYRPELAHYSPRPAVHWFSFPDLCAAGRAAGFARFYSPYDLLYLTERAFTPTWRFRARHWCRRQPWLRAAMVSQMVGDIFMWKRFEPEGAAPAPASPQGS
jgi:SAM-dependent methyltransferase